MRTFLDTHAWIWWITSDPRLSKRAKSAIEKCASDQGVWISPISIWEVAKKVQKEQLVLDRPFRQWLGEALNVRGLFVAELTVPILVESCELPQPFHGDPADQIIAASVRHHNGRLITKDSKLRDYPHLSTIW
ncbi:MAG TPA: type II toxin-antitoxin system VapC family toxin [Acidobacteriota bacterium]|nr:type II toxin-antitoxin system VapC family toxin [Acidobacteriota bacterium]